MSESTGQSVQSDILDAVVTALGSTASRYHVRNYADADLPAENVMAESLEPEYDDRSQSVSWILRFLVRYMVSTNGAIDKVADARMVWGTKLLNVDPTFGGLAVPGSFRFVSAKWDTAVAQTTVMVLEATYQVAFDSDRSDLALPYPGSV